jgi:RNA polymerase sigma-70 factor (ECF subfamily)
MFGVCLRYEPCREKASDILQDAFVKVFKSLNHFKGEGSFEGWIRKIVVRTALDEFRKTTRLYSVADYDDYDMRDGSPSVVSTMSANELMDMVKSLSPGYRTVFNLFAVEGFQHKEIAEMLNISEGTSKSQFARARATLQKMVLEQNPHYQDEYAAAN